MFDCSGISGDYDHDYRHISQEDARRIMIENLPLIVKPALVSGEGKNLQLISDKKAVVIEWNLGGIGMYHSQLTTGPLFGQYSDYFAGIARKMIECGL